MITDKEYFLLAFLSYCNFSKLDYNKKLIDIYMSDMDLKIFYSPSFNLFNREATTQFFNYFQEILKKWEIFCVDNRTVSSGNKSKSGFYAVVFKNEEDEYVIGYRGSEKYPLEDAYQDFVTTDLSLGIGRVPLQLHEGFDFYQEMIEEFNIDRNKIYLTGHSLGGGIAQYTAVKSYTMYDFIPITYTWNGIGMNRNAILSVQDFINFNEILKEKTTLDPEEISLMSRFHSDYKNFMVSELTATKILSQRRGQIFINYENSKNYILNKEFVERLMNNTNFNKFIKIIPYERRRDLLLNQKFISSLFSLDTIKKYIDNALVSLSDDDFNKNFINKIFNYGHSQDLTNSFYNHFGNRYLVDDGLKASSFKESFLIASIQLFKKSIFNYHKENVFLPFFNGDINGNSEILPELVLEYLASVSRKLLLNESLFERKFLAEYYSLAILDKSNFEFIKRALIKGAKKSTKFIIYKEKIIEKLYSMQFAEFNKFWEMLKERLSSPYLYQDIFDIIVYGY